MAHPFEAKVVEDRVQNRDQSNEPLARKLRNAAIDRTDDRSERVDDFVLDADGVIDLRDLDHDTLGSSVADPAKALAGIRGQLGDAHEISHLYDESEPEPSRWRLGLRARHAYGNQVSSAVPTKVPEVALPPTRGLPPLSRLSMVPLTAENGGPALADRAPIEEPEANDTGVYTADSITDSDAESDTESIAESIEPEIDLRDDERPTADCPKCMGLGHRDLFDRFSQVEFYSCDNCMHMWQQDLS